MSTFKERMAARDARKAEIAKAKKARHEADLDKLDELEQEHGDDHVRAVTTPAGLVIIRLPPKAQMDRFQEMILREGKPEAKASRRREAVAVIGRQCVLHPELTTYDEWCEEYGGIPTTVGNAAVEFGGLAEEEEAGK